MITTCLVFYSVPPSHQSRHRFHKHTHHKLHAFKPAKNPSFQIPTYSQLSFSHSMCYKLSGGKTFEHLRHNLHGLQLILYMQQTCNRNNSDVYIKQICICNNGVICLSTRYVSATTVLTNNTLCIRNEWI